MSATATLPLLLELTPPIKVSDLSADAIKEVKPVDAKYNPETQVRETLDGTLPIMFFHDTHCKVGGYSGQHVIDDVGY